MAIVLGGLQARRSSLAGDWFNAPAYADLAVVIDFNNWRAAITTVPLAGIPTATPEQLCVKRAATVEEAFAFTCSSTSARTYTDASGVLRNDLSVDQLRKDWINGRLQLALNGASTNLIRNNTMAGAVVGAPGTLPTGWSETLNGLTRQVIGVGQEDGIDYIDLRFSGTATGSFMVFANTNVSGYVSGQSYAPSVYWRLMAGAMTNVSSKYTVARYNLSPSGSADISIPMATPTGAPLRTQRQSGVGITTGTLTGTGIAFCLLNFLVGSTHDFTLRIGLRQLEQQPFATPPIPTSDEAVARAIESARLSPAVEAILQRSEASVIVKGQNMMRPQGHTVAPQTSSLIQSNATNERAVTNSASGVLVTGIGPNFTSAAYAAGMAFSGSGRSIVRNGAPVAADTGAVPARTAVYLARDGSGTFTADGWYDFVGIAPSRLANARLTELAVPVA